ncbi:putative disease resistance protein RGA4 [Aegilops tauschii subsp. strangulata]|uniref:Disease resistance protein RGA4 n=2 Tax=Aegilops tauschii subsp. strangulata TaxID=200361 RepID=A0A452XJ06_AEGTS|nr:putative disease resistance protein RGA4 [Aegilops tauschii subsp. strangulata]
MGEVVATMAIRPLVSMLMNKASSYLLNKYKVMEGMEEEHRTLERKLPAILDVITDAEEQATAHREGAKAWLQELKRVAHAANEVFDEFKYEALRREAKKKGHYSKLGFDVIKLFPTHNRIVFRYKMGRKLCRILQAIEVLIADMQAFGFKYQSEQPVSKDWRHTDYVIIAPQEIANRSRGKDKKKIVDTLLGQAGNADLAVVPIVGMGGLGKTTLAQLIYNEPKVQKHFQLLLWVCVSDTFDVNSLAKSIVEASPRKNDDIGKPPLDRLQKLVRGQRYLLVLDDVWNREVDKWERLKVCLQCGGTGSAVLTTTRDNQVAEIMGADRAYHLSDLDDSFLKEIIESRAFSPEKEKPAVLVKMVGEIVKRCCGSPLAAIALGSVLRTKTSVKEWKAISSRSSICTDETGILPILKLSYNDLPSHMKQCFAFCAVFPKDYKIDVEKLIQLWIAHGFIPEHREDSPETVGKHIFNELASRSFFLDIEELEYVDAREYFSITTCKIHDLMHDIAMSIMDKECVVATKESSQIKWLPDTTRHLFLSCEQTEGMLNDAMERGSLAIRTLLCDNPVWSSLQHLSKYRSLHALKLCIKTIPFLLKPKYLHHLRYLDLSESYIKALPENMSILYSLQTLDLSKCIYLDRLPRQMKYMTSLRHLYTHGCPELESMPPELGKLTNLQTLTCFVAAVTGPDCSDVAELQHLNLGGQLELCQIENVTEAEPKVANLGNKKELSELTLRWTFVCDSKVLDNFEPHDGLQVLKIYYYGGECIGMMQNMVEIHLFHCERLQFLFRRDASFTFPKLKVLTLEHLPKFERWWEINARQDQIGFPLLEKLFIKYCGMLTALPKAPLLREPCGGSYRLVRSPFPALKVLELEDLKSFQRWDVAAEGGGVLFTQLEKLSIKNCPKLMDLPRAPLLQELELKYLASFQRWDAVVEEEQILFPLLEKLSTEFPKVTELTEAPYLQEFKLKYLESLQRQDAVVEEQILFPLLQKLSIQKCPRLIDLPEAPKLSSLEIQDGKQEIFHFVGRYLSSLTKLILKLENTETTSEAECVSIVPMDNKEKWNQKSPLTVMKLRCCNSFFGAGAPEPWDYFGHLEALAIDSCDVLVHWPDKVFQSLVALRRLSIRNCKNLTGCAQAPPDPESSLHLPASATERSQHLPGLESIELINCASLIEMFNVPESLKEMHIFGCHELKSIFGKQQGMSQLVQGLSCSEVTVPTVVSELSSSSMNHFFPCLEYLQLSGCDSLSAVLDLPPSLKTISIGACRNIQVLSCQLNGLQKPQVTTSINIPEPSTAVAREHSLPPCLESLHICCFSGMFGGILHLPNSLKTLKISGSSLTSLEFLSGEHPTALESLVIDSCSTLASLPNDPQAYRSLQRLEITCCPAIKKLPTCLQQQLGSIGFYKRLDAHYEVTAFKPKTWKEIPRLVHERRQARRS